MSSSSVSESTTDLPFTEDEILDMFREWLDG